MWEWCDVVGNCDVWGVFGVVCVCEVCEGWEMRETRRGGATRAEG